MDYHLLQQQFIDAAGFPVLNVRNGEIISGDTLRQPDFGLSQALVASLPKSLPRAWTLVTPEGLLAGGIELSGADSQLILGPLFAFECTLPMARRLAHRIYLPDLMASSLQRSMNRFSPCDMKKLQNYLRFLNHLLNDETETEFSFLEFHWADAYRSEFVPPEPVMGGGDDLNIEDNVLYFIRSGKEKDLVRFFNEKLFIYDSPDHLTNVRQIRRYLLGANMYLSRVAVQAGVDPEMINPLVDHFGERIETIISREDFNHVFMEFTRQYAHLVARLETDSASPLVRRIHRYVQAHLYEPLSLADVAESLGYSKSYLCAEYKKAAGETVTHYIQRSKIREARNLLETHRISVGQAAEALGFSDSAYFIKVYKKIEGTTPGHRS